MLESWGLNPNLSFRPNGGELSRLAEVVVSKEGEAKELRANGMHNFGLESRSCPRKTI